MKFIQYFILSIPFVLAGCGSQSDGISGSATDVSETTVSPSRTVADFDSMSLAVTNFNTSGRNIVGEEVQVSVRVADNLNGQTVLDGAVVNFSAEGGAIGETCTIASGGCTVTWTSQNPIPSDGRVTIVAYMTGSESFKDLNSNGLYDAGDLFNDAETDSSGDLLRPDLSEPFRNDNKRVRVDATRPAFFINVAQNTARDSSEIFFDTPGLTDNSFDGPDGKFSGASCAHPTDCSTAQSLFIWREIEIIMGTNNSPHLSVYSTNPESDAAAALIYSTSPVGVNTLVNVSGGAQTVYVVAHDSNGNPLPSGTTIGFTETDVASTQTDTVTVGGQIYADAIPVTLSSDGTSSAGTLVVLVTTPEAGGIAGVAQPFTLTTMD